MMVMDERVSCRNCGSVYEISWIEFGETDEGSRDCEVCGTYLASWRANRIPLFLLIKRGKLPSEGA